MVTAVAVAAANGNNGQIYNGKRGAQKPKKTKVRKDTC